MQKQANRFAEAAFKALIAFMNGLAETIRTHRGELAAAGGNIADALVGGVTDYIRNAWSRVKDAIVSMAKSAAAGAKGAVKGAVNAILPGPDVFKQSGKAIEPLTGSFAKLVGGSDAVKEALQSIGEQIHSTLEKANGDVEKWQKKLNELKKKGGDPKAIEHAQKMLKAARKLQDQAQEATEAFKRNMKKRGDDLRSLAKQYDDIQARIAEATKTVQDAEAKVASFKQGVMNTFADIPAPEAGQSLHAYMRELQKQTEKVIKFKQMLAAAQGLGLDPAQVEWFLAQGLDASKMLEQLIAGGPEAISQFEAAQGNLQAAGQGMADFFASTLPGYDDAVKTAKDVLQGIIDGVGDAKSLAELEKAMGKIARIMMKAIRKELQVKSPSRKMMEIGVFAVKGLTKGLDAMHKDVAASSAALGTTALDTLQATLANASGINADLSMSPVITPVLDLTQLTRDANSISSLMNVTPLNAAVSFAQASDISASKMAADGSTNGSSDVGFTEIKFEQNNYSPEALDDVTIYRSTKNVISIAKEALGIP
jgi:predicted  nucleic acid-binding Zn-ribbon protein